MNIAQLYILLL